MLNAILPSIIIIIVFVAIFGIKFIRGYISRLQLLYGAIFGCYIASLVAITFFPFPFQKLLIDEMIESNLGQAHNFIPFKAFVDAFNSEFISADLKQIGGNIALFLPLGFALPLLFPNIKSKKVILAGFLISLSIEVLQGLIGLGLGYNYRSSDIDDLILNTFGAILGLLLWNLLYNPLNKLGLIITPENNK